MNPKIKIAAITVLTLLTIFLISIKLYRDQEKQNLSFLQNTDFTTFVKDHSPRLGDPKAPIYVVEFFDPECESCKEFHPYVKMLVREFEGKVQLVVRYAPFHQNSLTAVKILEASRKQNKFWEVLDILYMYQEQWGSHHDPKPELMWKHLPESGVDVEQIRKDMEANVGMINIQSDMDDLNKLQVRATPTFFINGKALQNFGKEGLREAIEAEVRALEK